MIMKSAIKFSRSISLNNLPNQVLKRTKLLILDSFTAMILGNQNDEVIKLSHLITEPQESNNINSVPILGTYIQTDFRTAALINGVGMVSDELDEGNPLAKGHPAAHFLPALLSISFRYGTSGRRLIEAFIANYEISARVGASIKLKPDVHPHGNWGIFGNGFGVGKILGFNQDDEYIKATLLSSNLTMPNYWDSILEGHNIRNLMIGLNNYHTTMLSEIVQAGFTTSFSTPEKILNQITEKNCFECQKELYETYYLMKSYFKFYPYCRFCHSSIDAIKKIISKKDINNIKKINVHTYYPASKLSAQKVNNEFAGKFSIPFAMASEVYNDYFDENNKNSFVDKFMELINVSEYETYTKALPHERITTVIVEFKSGKNIQQTEKRATGDPDEMDIEKKIINKSKFLLYPHLGKERTNKLIERTLNLDHVSNIANLKPFLKK